MPRSADEIAVADLITPPKAQYKIRLTSQRITYGYYRIDQVAFVVPLDMKKAQNPSPLVWVLKRENAPRAFEYYLGEYAQLFQEALNVFPAQ